MDFYGKTRKIRRKIGCKIKRLSRKRTSFTLDNLPNELIVLILNQLETGQYINLSRTNSRFFTLTKPFLYTNILVYNSDLFHKLEYASTRVMGTFRVPYTVVSRKNFLKLLDKGFDDITKCVFFYRNDPEPELLNRLPPNCTIEIETSRNSSYHTPRVQYLFDNTGLWTVKVRGSCSEYGSTGVFDLNDIAKDVVSLKIYNLEDCRNLRFENLTSLEFIGPEPVPRDLVDCNKLEYLQLSSATDNWELISYLVSKNVVVNVTTREWSEFCTDRLDKSIRHRCYKVVVGGTREKPVYREIYCGFPPLKYNLLEGDKSIETQVVDYRKIKWHGSLRFLETFGRRYQYYKVVRGRKRVKLVPIFKEVSRKFSLAEFARLI